MSTVKNYISGARSWINHHKGDDSAFASTYVGAVTKFNINKSTHVTNRAPLLTIDHVHSIVSIFDINSAVLPVFKAAFFLGYLFPQSL